MNPTRERTATPVPTRRWLFLWALGAGLLALAVLDAAWLVTAAPPSTGALRLELRTTVNTRVRVRFDTGQGFLEDGSVTRSLDRSPGFHALYFPLPAAPVRSVRVDPLDAPGQATLRSVTLARESPRAPVRTLPLESVQGLDGDTQVSRVPDGWLVTHGPGAAVPALQIASIEPPILPTPGGHGGALRLVTVDALLFLLVAVAAFTACFGWPSQRHALVARWLPDGWTALLCVLPLAGAALYYAAAQRESYYLEAMVTSDRDVIMQAYFDGGEGFLEENSTRVRVAASATPRAVRFPITVDRIVGLRFDPSEEPATVRVTSMIVRSRAEQWLRRPAAHEFDLRDMTVYRQVESLRVEDGGNAVVLTMGEGAQDPVTTFDLPGPVPLGANWFYVAGRTAIFALGWLAFWVAAAEAARRFPGPARERLLARVRGMWRRLSPAQAVWLVAAASVVLSCYPVIFCGKSFDSPNFADGTFQLYENFPTLPGTTDTELENGRGADLGSMAWAHGPYSVVESRALFHDHELPLWNRYNDAGTPLLGQGQSMFGDPLHGIVLLAGGRAWAWDVKFILAKLLLAAGIGLVVLTATGCLPAALLLGFSSAFIGFFAYRLNHPAYFSFCYAPWILYAWLRIVQAPTWRRAMGWGGALILANWIEMNSGTAKEAYMLLLCLNACGALLLGLARVPAESKGWRFLGLGAVGGIFCLLASPVLLTFVDTLQKSVSNYDDRHAWQLQPGMFIGLFDDIFYRQFNHAELHFDPSGNFLLLAGCLFALSGFKRLIRDRVFVAIALSALPPLALAFGVVPPSFIRDVPLLGNVAHVDNTFSCVLLIELFVLAGFGFRHCLALAGRRAWHRDALVALLLGGALLGLYFGFAQAAQHASHLFLQLNEEIPRSAFFYTYVPTVALGAVGLSLMLRRLAVRGPELASVALLGCCLCLLHWRMGLQLHTAFARFTPVLPNRVNLLAPSPAVDFLHADQASPFRAAGLGKNLMLGYGGVAGVETISGPDALVNRYFHGLETTGLRFVDGATAQTANPRDLAAIKPFYDLLNVRYYLTRPGDALGDLPGVTRVRSLDLDVYRNDRAWPRAFFVDRLGTHTGPAGFAAHVLSGDGRPFAEVDTEDLRARPDLRARLAADPAARTVAPAANYHLTSNGTAFDLDAPGPGVAVLAEVYMDDDFVARLDGRPVPAFRVNQAFRGLVVDRAGHHRVSFTYRPRHFTLSLCAATLGLGLLAAAGWWLSRARAGQSVAASAEKLDHAGGLS